MTNSIHRSCSGSPADIPPAAARQRMLVSNLTRIRQTPLSLPAPAQCQPAPVTIQPDIPAGLTPVGEATWERIISGQYKKEPDQTPLDHAKRLARLASGITHRDLARLSGANLSLLLQKIKLRDLKLSEAGLKVQKLVIAAGSDYARQQNESRREHARRLKNQFSDLTRTDALLITGERRGNLRNVSEFITQPLSASGREVQKKIAAGEYQRAGFRNNLAFAVWIKERHPQLSAADASILTHAPLGSLENNWAFTPWQLSARAQEIQQLMASPAASLYKRGTESLVVWLRRLRKLLPELSNREISILAKVDPAMLPNIPEFIRTMTAVGERIQRILASEHPGAYQPAAQEDNISWIKRIKRELEPQLPIADAAKLTGELVNSLRLEPEFYTTRMSQLEHTIMTIQQSDIPGHYARYDDETQEMFMLRLRGMHPSLTVLELSRRSGMSIPAVRRELRRHKPSPPGAAATKLLSNQGSPDPAAKTAGSELRPAPGLTSWLVTPVTVYPRYENDYARAQWTDPAFIDWQLRNQGFQRIPNNSSTGDGYANCLLIALLQHATGYYWLHNPAINAHIARAANNYRQWLRYFGWEYHPSGFTDDGYMAFGNHGEQVQGAAAALINMINNDLLAQGERPLRVVNHSFAAGQEFTEQLGSQAENARVVHIVNTGQHYEALIRRPDPARATAV